MKCERCTNDDKRYFIKFNDEYVCRKCLMFKKGLSENDHIYYSDNIDSEYSLSFELSAKQKELSKELLLLSKNKVDVLIYAACGSGKTEIILEMLSDALSNNLKVGIAIPRRQVVLELRERLQTYFKNLNVIAVCEGYTKVIYGDLIVATTHQLYNYHNYFDILVIDEPDAFPFYNNELLINIAKASVKGSVVYLSATPSTEMLQLKTLTLFQRFHNHKLDIPKVIVGFKFYLFYKLLEFIKNNNKVLLFVSSISKAKKLSKLLKYPCIHSKTNDKEVLIKQFAKGTFNVLITTTIMERGITIEGVNVCVYECDHEVFNEASLIQIAGRVGRTLNYPSGNILFLATRKSKKVLACVKSLTMMNA